MLKLKDINKISKIILISITSHRILYWKSVDE